MAKKVAKAVVKTKVSSPAKISKESKEAVSTEIIIASVEQKAKGAFAKLKRITRIDSQEDVEVASNQVKVLKELAKEADTQKTGITDPIYQSIERIEELFKPFADKVKKADTDLKTLILDYAERQEKKLQQAQEDFKDGKIKKVSTFTEKTSALQVGSAGAAKFKNVSQLFITDVKKIPLEYMVPDETKIKEALKAGKKVPGAEMRKVKKVSI